VSRLPPPFFYQLPAITPSEGKMLESSSLSPPNSWFPLSDFFITQKFKCPTTTPQSPFYVPALHDVDLPYRMNEPALLSDFALSLARQTHSPFRPCATRLRKNKHLSTLPLIFQPRFLSLHHLWPFPFPPLFLIMMKFLVFTSTSFVDRWKTWIFFFEPFLPQSLR